MVDDGEGPEFYCSDEGADLVRQWELGDQRDRWKHTGEAPPKPAAEARPSPRPYSTPQSTIDAFWSVTRNNDAENLSRWLLRHPMDARTLHKLWEGKNARP